MFGDKTFGNRVTFAVDGQEIMRLIYEKMREAKTSIWIANYDLDPDLSLVRENDLQQQPRRQKSQKSDLVTSSCISESTPIDKKIVVMRVVLRF